MTTYREFVKSKMTGKKFSGVSAVREEMKKIGSEWKAMKKGSGMPPPPMETMGGKMMGKKKTSSKKTMGGQTTKLNITTPSPDVAQTNMSTFLI